MKSRVKEIEEFKIIRDNQRKKKKLIRSKLVSMSRRLKKVKIEELL